MNAQSVLGRKPKTQKKPTKIPNWLFALFSFIAATALWVNIQASVLGIELISHTLFAVIIWSAPAVTFCYMRAYSWATTVYDMPSCVAFTLAAFVLFGIILTHVFVGGYSWLEALQFFAAPLLTPALM